ncbi:hypothetical protein JR316_0006228 [Psilocybe cubensis]|uniref:Arrestin-like N-terminal domain-containing protein n=2 Tax=Psilocybe cubensis TaxID=181762 RepID=A0A8H7XYW0_PSICU|nr:hypothetical protein JR316_0006228 [Psilocybe cubensis]KAH9481701.1 hypothetical protein JR316_0006228 [Psilocybe cubensis]
MSATQTVPPQSVPGFLPPDYSSPLNETTSIRLDSELPAYVPPPPASSGSNNGHGIGAEGALGSSQPKEFHSELKKKGKTIATLTLIADSALSKGIPTYAQGQPIKGRVKLNLEKPETIQSVVVTVRGQVITGAGPNEHLTFVDISRVPWSQSDGEPLNSSSDDGNSTPTPTASTTAPATTTSAPSVEPSTPKFTGKLQGEYTWPFKVDLPKQVVVLSGGLKGEPQTFALPQTFSERHARASVLYEVSLQLTKGKLRADYRVASTFGYIPITRPPPFSTLRRLAYEEGTTLLGPTIDPEGWFSPEPAHIKGTIFNNRVTQVKCTLYLAKPLSYTRSSVLPVCLSLESADTQALDLLSSPKAVVARLRRRVRCRMNADKTMESLAWKDTIDDSQLAIWWPSTKRPEDSQSQRFVNGELHLRADIKPTSSMAHFRIEYTVVLLPFDAPGFVSADISPLIEYPVEIVTSYAPGPRPRMSAPPGYESDVPVVTYGITSMRSTFY